MSKPVVFLIIVAGIAVGSLLSKLFTRNDIYARVAWSCAGASPGVALLVGEPRFMLFIPVCFLPLLLRRKKRDSSESGRSAS